MQMTIIAPAAPTDDTAGAPSDSRLLTFSSKGSGAFTFAPSLWSWLGRHGDEYDVVHVHGLLNPISSVAARLCLAKDWTLVIRPFGTLSRYTYSYRRSRLKEAYFHLVDRTNVREANALHFTSDAEREEAEWRTGSQGERGFVIPPPWIPSLNTFAIERRDDEVLFLGRLHPIKAIESLIAAWPLVLNRRPSARLTLAGGGEPSYVNVIYERVKGSGLAQSVELVGMITGSVKERLLRKSTILVLPSYHENFGYVVLEAVASGMPVVVSAEVQSAPFIINNGFGTIADRSAEGLATALCDALENKEMQMRCQALGAQVVNREFSAFNIGRELASMYGAVRAHRGM